MSAVTFENKKYPLIIFIYGATNALDGRKCIGHSGAEIFASEECQKKMDGAFILVPLANEKREENGTLKDSWGPEYVSIIKKMADETIALYKNQISGVFLIGGSSGGYMTWAILEAYPNFFAGAMPVSIGYIPSSDILRELQKNNVQIVFAIGKHDEFGNFNENITSRINELKQYDNITCFFHEWVRNGDHGVASLYFEIEMGQHCIITQIQANLTYDDGTPYCNNLPQGITDWIKSLV